MMNSYLNDEAVLPVLEEAEEPDGGGASDEEVKQVLDRLGVDVTERIAAAEMVKFIIAIARSGPA